MQIDWFPLWLSLRVAFVSTAIAFVAGLWLAYILANRELMPRVASCTVLREHGTSDHAPVIMTLAD